MVNTGKPSRGCEPCKKRHVKCDLTLPHCRKCLDSGRVCPGVPDETDLRFVKQKDPFKTRKRKSAAPKKEQPAATPKTVRPTNTAVVKTPDRDGTCDSAVELDVKNSTPRSNSNTSLSTDVPVRSTGTSPQLQQPPPHRQQQQSQQQNQPSQPMQKLQQQHRNLQLQRQASFSTQLPPQQQQQQYQRRQTQSASPAPPPPAVPTTHQHQYHYQHGNSPAHTELVTIVDEEEADEEIIPVRSEPSRELTPSWDNIAVTFFFDNFMAGDSIWIHPVVRTLQQVTRMTSFKRNSAADHSTIAISLAALSHYPDCGHLRAQAISHHSKALRLTHVALGNPEASKQDDTLLAVILMGMYERIACQEEVSEMNLLQHSMGALALVQHRGVPSTSNTAFYQLFSVVRTSMVLEFAAEGAPMDESEMNSFWFATPHDPTDHNTNLYYLGKTVPELRFRARNMFGPYAQLPNKDSLSDLLADARAVDTKLLQWFQNLPDEWSYYSVNLVPDKPIDIEHSPIWPGPQHIYKDMFLASNLNNYRILRIFTQSVIAQCLSALDAQQTGNEGPPTSFLYSATLQTVRFLVDDIASSVPSEFSMDLNNPAAFPIPDLPEWRHVKAKEALGSFYLMRPLWVASCVEGIDELQKRWLKGRLRFIGDEYGLRQASALGESKVVFPMAWRTNCNTEHSELLYFHP